MEKQKLYRELPTGESALSHFILATFHLYNGDKDVYLEEFPESLLSPKKDNMEKKPESEQQGKPLTEGEVEKLAEEFAAKFRTWYYDQESDVTGQEISGFLEREVSKLFGITKASLTNNKPTT
jgi:hypothetical protein